MRVTRWWQQPTALAALAALSAALTALPAAAQPSPPAPQTLTAITGVRLIDGRGGAPLDPATLVFTDGGCIVSAQAGGAVPAGARVLDYRGRTIIPGLITDHSHVGLVDGLSIGPENYTRPVIEAQLAQYRRYGLTTVTSISNNAPLFDRLRAEAHAHRIEGEDLFGADQGIGAPRGAPPFDQIPVGPDQIQRPATPEEAVLIVRGMAASGSDLIKLWLDDFGGTVPHKMKPEIYRAVIDESHRLGLRVAVHIHDLADATAVVDAGADILAHGVRDKPVPPALIDTLRRRGVWYIATLQLDEASFAWADQAPWTRTGFARAALSPAFAARVFDDPVWRRKQLADPMTQAARQSLAMNQRNLKTLYDAGVKIGFGTDSGATPDRVPGLAEHRELQLSVDAGLTPLQAIGLATANAAALLGLHDRGVLAPGTLADFVVLDADPSRAIDNTMAIHETWTLGHPAPDPRIDAVHACGAPATVDRAPQPVAPAS